jgi:maltooligosyltrehalose trehalohydrolase
MRFRHDMPFGAAVLEGDNGVRFRLYAPGNDRVELVYDAGSGERRVPMTASPGGWFECVVPEACAHTRYRFSIGELLVPDPASRSAPEGVHGRSSVVDPSAFLWPDDGWKGRPWSEHVFYELHVGTFTPEGTYAGAATKLAYLKDLGVTAIELMPLAEAPGAWNWGYDGVLPFAPSHNYGTPDELKAFIAAAHAHGLSVFLDVVYNHFGPEANYLHAYARTFYTDRYHTPWGSAIDLDPDGPPDIRRFFIENALYWLEEFRFDGLRFDAVHEIYDGPERSFLRELARTVLARTDRPVYLVLENEGNEATLLEAGFRAQWADDLHNAMHVAITGQTEGYYADFADRISWRIARALSEGFIYQGEPSSIRGGKPRGEPSSRIELASFITFLQNHDQVGNRPFGDRISATAPHEAVRAAVAIVLLAPATPMLFMGEEWGASTPFLFFCDFEPELAEKVTEGRRSEFAGFAEFSDPAARERIPDPSGAATLRASVLHWDEAERAPHATWLALYRELLRLRREEIAPRTVGLRGTGAGFELLGERGMKIRWQLPNGATLLLEANLGAAPLRGFAETPEGRTVYATHPAPYAGSEAPPWSVRWSLA